MCAMRGDASLRRMPLWILTIAICAAIWVIGTILVALGATRLVRHQPD